MKHLLLLLFFGLIEATPAIAIHGRLTETSITETGRLHSLPQARLKTKGYGLTYIFDFGLGLSLTQLKTSGNSGETSVSLDHSYADISYTRGDEWLMTFGTGFGIDGKAKIGEESTRKFSAVSYHLGVGYRFRWFEVYWINRQNYMRYRLDGRSVRMTSTHYQLGLGVWLN